MHQGLTSAGIWQDTGELPDSLAATIDGARGFDDVVRLLSRPGTRRLVASGNGASYYVAQALWLAAIEGDRYPIEVVAVPAGLLARGAFRWRDGDVFVAVSSSGEMRDVIEALESPSFPRPFALITATPDSTLGRTADACALVSVPNQRAVTHTQAFCGAVLACLAIWARFTDDGALAAIVDQIKRDGPTATDLAKIKETQRRSFEKGSRENSFWAGQLIARSENAEDLKNILTYPALVDGLTADMIRAAANRYLRKDNYVRVSLVPEKPRT